MLDFLINLDRHLLLALNGSDSTFMDSVMMSVTHTGTWALMMAVLLVVLFRNNGYSRVAMVVFFIALTVIIADQFSSSFCKPLFHRLRPSHEPWFGDAVDIVNGHRGGLYGFISSHAANTFGVAVFVSLLVRQRVLTCVMFLWAVLASYSRIYLGVHYPGDIFCGAVWGTVTGLFTYFLYARLSRRLDGGRQFFSSRYTATGYLIEDAYWLCASFFATFVFVLLKACFCQG